MSEQAHRRRPRWPWVLGAFGVAALAILVTIGVYLFSGPSPRLAQVAKEPVLVAPIPAVELGRETRQSAYGFGFGSYSAYVTVAYQVDATPQDALAAWAKTYGPRYQLGTSEPSAPLSYQGSMNNMWVTVTASDRVQGAEQPSSFKAPAPGATVVTVRVSGKI